MWAAGRRGWGAHRIFNTLGARGTLVILSDYSFFFKCFVIVDGLKTINMLFVFSLEL